ncbi:phosphoglucosamine mutase [Desulfomicrobium baculatum]|uniref:Phosphoglucosamine mutase n=1 Tax=Desulfomicrobium baculatum (strain DSM 4028 / VKM B-1378 / X) TaxID=525897 RepID=C7LUV0_DESBD|nr:phosphoglucosamine mutase [Desulfomicrobium baculatum]ACU88384.1 phosphoglucosamine mutase [Desulfomicrobium baculatum DSM 4028]
MGRLFGTDGIRGRVNSHPMQPELVLRLGLAAGQYFRNGNKRHRVVIGKDTRLSGYVFESALTSGFCAAGMDVFLVGPLPTPAISFLTRNMRADLGVVISASHNPYMDNGIKFFNKDGFKLADRVEDEIAAMVTSPDFVWKCPDHDQVGRARKIQDSPGRYIVELKHSFPAGMTLDGLTIVLDCAHGAAYRVAPLIFEELGARVITLGIEPDGLNINKGCGSLHPEVLAAKVREHRADIGLALDGDADRLIVVDEYGTILDGDQIMAVCADEMMARGTLAENTLVATVMSNMALEVFMQERGGRLLRTKVGDRYVVEEMRKGGYLLGGEQSGHLVFMQHSTTGDGTLAALQLLSIMVGRQKPISEIAGLLTPYPQKLVNLKVKKKVPFDTVPVIKDAVRHAEDRLGRTGRVLLRYSGTESLARIMVEAQDQALVDELCASLTAAVESGLA